MVAGTRLIATLGYFPWLVIDCAHVKAHIRKMCTLHAGYLRLQTHTRKMCRGYKTFATIQ